MNPPLSLPIALLKLAFCVKRFYFYCMLTITEALSEINLIKKKLVSKRGNVTQNLTRALHVKDPYESQGGSEAMIRAEVQSIADLGATQT
jgi:hypothetical protein